MYSTEGSDIATTKSNIWFQSGFDDSNPRPEKNLNFTSLVPFVDIVLGNERSLVQKVWVLLEVQAMVCNKQ